MGSPSGPSPASDLAAPQTPASAGGGASDAGAISLADLTQEIRNQRTTSTTRPRTATTSVKAITTTTTAPAPTTTTAPAPLQATAPPSTTPLTPLTTLLARVVPPAVAVAGALTRADSGVASWFNAPDGTCAHRTLPMGTTIKVVRAQSGAAAACKVSDRGPTVETGRLIDLSLDVFEKLASRDTGLIDVRIEW